MQKHILIIDDEQSIRELCKEFLEEEGYKVTLAVDGQDGLDKMNYDDFDLYLVDMVMPRMDGLETMKRIKKKQPLAVIIITTGFSSIEGAVKAVHAGAFQYLSKPINAEELLEAVKKGLQYAEDLYGPLQKAFEPGTEGSKGEPLILNGFTAEDKNDFMALGRVRKYEAGQTIAIEKEDANSIILVESGEVSIWLSNTTVDYLRKNDTWAEENFILASSTFTTLRAETSCRIKLFDRKKLLDFFAYKGERLMKRFMINLINTLFSKWRKAIQRIVMLKLVTGEK
ncbi:MAG TPA: response regulator [Candidatus Cloacimonetes bacterium]|nr:response regulator [Candidatus Cloacimonadota bacterium]HEX38388.1 response regulator [Candidatus Cloacimonadota bacterium]